MSNNRRKVIFYAPFGVGVAPNKDGGAESGGRRNLHILQEAGYQVMPVSKAVNLGNLLAYAFTNLKNVFVLNRFFRNNPESIFHISGMYGKLLPFELYVIKLARRNLCKVVYDIRNGDFVSLFNRMGKMYRLRVDKLASCVDVFLCQGREFETFIRSRYSVKALYFPNFVMDAFVPEKNPEREMNCLKMVYTGRVVKKKNIGFLIDVLKSLEDYSVGATMEIVGGYDMDYYRELCRKIDGEGLTQSVTFTGKLDSAALASALSKAHIFLFPSTEPREGHSNSLTEAMAYGVVPVASPAGFNREVTGDERCVVEEMNPDLYAERIMEIWNGNWEIMSKFARERVLNNYSQRIGSEVLLKAYASL